MALIPPPPCSPFDPSATRCLLIPRPLHRPNMTARANNTFSIPSSTALGVSENLMRLLNDMIPGLPVLELRKLRNELKHTLRVAEEALYIADPSIGFDMLTLGDGTYL